MRSSLQKDAVAFTHRRNARFGPIVGIEPQKRHTLCPNWGEFSECVIGKGCSFPSARNARERLPKRKILEVARFAGLYGSACRDMLT